MRNVVVTGGAGFIGSHVVDRLLADRRARVTVLDNFDGFYDPAVKRANVAAHAACARFRLVEGDVRDPVAVEEALGSGRVDAVIHLAALAGVRPSLENPVAYETTNVVGTYTVLEAARRHDVRKLVFGSSSSVYGVNEKTPFAEDDRVDHVISPYAATKLAGEAACRVYSHLYGLRVVCLRFFTVYGARQRPDLAIHKFARLMTTGEPIPVYGDGTTRRDYTYVDDIVSGVLGALDYDATPFEIVNLGESRTVELRELIRILELAVGTRARLRFEPAQPGDVPCTFADIGKARRLFGYEPATGIEQGVARFAEWFRSTGFAMGAARSARLGRAS